MTRTLPEPTDSGPGALAQVIEFPKLAGRQAQTRTSVSPRDDEEVAA